MKTKTPVREAIGLNDANGKAIHLGDIVEFWHCACEEHGANGLTTVVQRCLSQVRMVDYVYKARLDDGAAAFYFCSAEPTGGAHAWRYNKGCRVIGRLPEDAARFVDALMFVHAGNREDLIEQVKKFKLEHSNV